MFKTTRTLLIYIATVLFSNLSVSLPLPMQYESTRSYTPHTTRSFNPTAVASAPLPIVLLHGISTNASHLQNMSEWLDYTFQRPVYNIEIGNGAITSIYSPIHQQLNQLCNTIYTTAALKNGFDFIGISQGGLLARGYVERCNAYPVRNLITLVSPHGGVINKNVKLNMYSPFYQNHFSVSNYWRDPRNIIDYLMKCTYLPILNNELILYDMDDEEDLLTQTQRENIKSLHNFVMIWSSTDKIIFPQESAKFSFYNEEFKVIPLEETELYKTDALGLKYLNENSKLHIFETSCAHEDYGSAVCFEQLYPIFKLYL
jgi:palmitoyl-protein thioesterase